MAHTICGVDVGTYSIKFAFLEVGFRTHALRGLLETAVPPGEAPLLLRQLDAVREGLAQVSSEVTPYFALPGDQLSVRVLELPFSDSRKIDQVVGYELEGQIVNAIEDVVFDHLVVGQRPEGSIVMAAAARRDDLAAIVAAAEERGIHPRALFAAPLIYRTLLPSVANGDSGTPIPCQAVLDFGHQRTNMCFVRAGDPIYARTIRRGGEHLTAAIAKAFNADLERAEQAKRSDAFLVSPGRAATTPLGVKLDSVLREALAPTIRELRQTLAGFSAGNRFEVDSLLVVGGGGRLAGLLPFLEAELGIPARYPSTRAALESGGQQSADGAGEEGAAPESDIHALAAAIAIAASRGSREIDFRRGPFVYRASFSILRQRALHIAALAGALLIAGGIDVGAKYSQLKNERKALDKDLKTATQELFGQPRDDAEAITQLMRRGFREELAPVPRATAFDLLDQISRKMPPGLERSTQAADATKVGAAAGAAADGTKPAADGTKPAADESKPAPGGAIKLDVTELEIRPKKTFIKGTVDTAAAVDEMAAKLKEIDCFEDVAKGSITEVSGGAKQFTLTVGAKCP
jgi:Tfp pilus assembly PilM family ATPase